jgi:Subtilase family/Bacterial Ig-like domain
MSRPNRRCQLCLEQLEPRLLLTSTSGPFIGIDALLADPRFADLDGAGFAVAIVDTGIDLDHPFFGPDADGDGVADRIVHQWDYADDDADASDADGHGTLVASIAASSDATYTGMAPAADIIALKVFSDTVGFAQTGDIAAALRWVAENATTYNIAAVNISISSSNYDTPYEVGAVAAELAELAALDILVCASSGNQFGDIGSEPGVTWPAADPNCIAVGSIYDADHGAQDGGDDSESFTTGPDRIVSYAQRHPTLTDVFAPGAFITGAAPGGGTDTSGGTSFASPHVAGLAVLAQQLAEREMSRRLNPVEWRALLDVGSVLIVDGDDEDDSVRNTGAVYPRLDAPRLAEAILDMAHPALDATAPAVAAQTPAVTGRHAMDIVTVQFDDLMDTTGFSLDDVTAFTGPVGDLLGSLQGFSWIDSATLEVRFAPITRGGAYQLVLSPDVEDDAGNPLGAGEHAIDFRVPHMIYTADMSVEPGWTLDGIWEYGPPQGQGGSQGEDPSAGATGPNVIGYNLAGYYGDDLSVAFYARAPAVDCSLWSDVHLSFQRWLGVEGAAFDRAAIEVSTDGSEWHEVWSNPVSDFEDDRWRLRSYDIGDIADGHHSVQIRWAMGPTDYSMAWAGWNIDDVLMTGFPSDPSISVPVTTPVLTPASDTGTSAGDGLTRMNTGLTFSIENTHPGATIRLYVDGAVAGTGTGNGASVSVTTTGTALTDGVHLIHATQTQSGLEESAASTAASITVDTVPPVTPSAPDMTRSSDTGLFYNDNITGDATPTFVIAPTDARIRFYVDGVVQGEFAATSTFTVGAVADGVRAFTYTAIDAAGNESAMAPILLVTVDTTPDALPPVIDLQPGSDTGASDNDDVTFATDLTFDVTTSAAYFRIYRAGVPASAAPLLGHDGQVYRSGAAETLLDQPAASLTYTATGVDVAGNETAPSAPLTVQVTSIAVIATHTYAVEGLTVTICDADATDGISSPVIAWDYGEYQWGATQILVSAGWSGDSTISAITLSGTGADTADLVIVVEGGGVGLVLDMRSEPQPLAALLFQGGVGYADIRGGLTGAVLNDWQAPAGWTPAAGDVGLLTTDDVGVIRVTGDVRGDIWIGGDASMLWTVGDLHADVHLPGSTLGLFFVSRAYDHGLRTWRGGGLAGTVQADAGITSMYVAGNVTGGATSYGGIGSIIVGGEMRGAHIESGGAIGLLLTGGDCYNSLITAHELSVILVGGVLHADIASSIHAEQGRLILIARGTVHILAAPTTTDILGVSVTIGAGA